MSDPLKRVDNGSPEGQRFIPNCPVCSGRMETIYSRGHQDVSVCVDCGSDLTIPTTAWNVLKLKQNRSA